MKKVLPPDEISTRAKRREIKKRPRMKLHGAGLKKRPGHPLGKILKKT